MNRKKVLIIFGTRPEAIKLAPLAIELKQHPEEFETTVCVTAQHREMLDQVLEFFGVTPEHDLDIMKPGQDLFDVTCAALSGLKQVLAEVKPDWVVIQGDTTTCFVSSLAAYYTQTKVAHVEAGLRSFNKYSPFPEEINRVLTGHITDLHFAPTQNARENLLRESIDAASIHVVGNTVIDALLHGVEKVRDRSSESFGEAFAGVNFHNFERKLILVTGHRRESFGEPFMNICRAIKELAQRDDVMVVYPVHLNPNVRKPVFEILSGLDNVHLIEPLDYPSFIWLMDKAYLILTDSGGVQEEAPSLGKPVLVMRDVTERTEGVDAGTAKLVGTNTEKIVAETVTLLDDTNAYTTMSNKVNPYGTGQTCRQIREVLAQQ